MASPTVYRLSDLPAESRENGTIDLRALRSESAMVAIARIKPTGERALHGLHRHPYDQLVIVLEGTMSIHVEGKDYEVPADSAINIPARAWHTGRALGDRDARIFEILVPVRSEYVHLTSHQLERFVDTSGETWFATESDKHSTHP